MSAIIIMHTSIAAPPETAFDLELDVNAHTESLSFSREAVIGPHSKQLGEGDQITWRARHLGVYWTMTVRISAYDKPRSFADEQVSGPFAYFRHVHRFASGHPGGTEMIDEISFKAPLGFLGWIAERVILTRYLARMIATRNEYLRILAERDRPGR
jgi:ligand-binding SRPBCC domain-containing protein